MAKIMLVEDDNNLREIYAARLQAEGHEIVAAKDGEEALALAVKEKPELIISDVMMPRISGFDMLDILRNAPETKNTKVIMMTALSQAEDKARADKLGADRYLVKSQVTLEDVARTVKDVLEGKPDPVASNPHPQAAPATPPPAEPEPAPATAAPAETPVPVPAAPETVQPVAPSSPPAPAEPAATAAPDPAPATDTSLPVTTTNLPVAPAPTDDNSTNAAATTTASSSDPTTTDANDTAAKQVEIKTPDPAPAIAVELPTPPDEIASQAAPEAAPATPPKAEEALVGPSLAEALANEEQAAEAAKSGDNVRPLDMPAPAPIVNGAPTPVTIAVETPPSEQQTTAPEITTPQEPDPKSGEPTAAAIKEENNSVSEPHPAEQIAGKKVIKPINDPTKKPDLNQLLAKEEQMAAAENPAANTIIKPLPSGTELPDDPSAPPKPDDHDSIAL